MESFSQKKWRFLWSCIQIFMVLNEISTIRQRPLMVSRLFILACCQYHAMHGSLWMFQLQSYLLPSGCQFTLNIIDLFTKTPIEHEISHLCPLFPLELTYCSTVYCSRGRQQHGWIKSHNSKGQIMKMVSCLLTSIKTSIGPRGAVTSHRWAESLFLQFVNTQAWWQDHWMT